MENDTRNKGSRRNQYFKDYVVFDLETTGISVKQDEIIEISAIKVQNEQIISTFSTLVNPMRPIPYRATAVNHITDEMVKDAPTIQESMKEFMKFIDHEILVGHNIHSFDMNFIYDAAMNQLQTEITNDYVDTLFLARTCLPQLKHHKLSDISNYFHISTKGAHRALNDCVMNQKCYVELGKLAVDIPVYICPNCGNELVKRTGKFGVFYGCSSYPKCKFTRNV